jgi:hypothetical protein
MSNPWTKKNPFMSMWLSQANRVAGAARSRATAEVHRQMSTAMTQGTNQMIDFWAKAFTPPSLSRPASRKRRR